MRNEHTKIEQYMVSDLKRTEHIRNKHMSKHISRARMRNEHTESEHIRSEPMRSQHVT